MQSQPLSKLKVSRPLFYGMALALIWLPTLLTIRFLNLGGGLFETHYIRQNQTALTVRSMARNETGFLDYASPFSGKLWNFNRELPVYQWISSQLVKKGISLEKATRATTLFFFLLTAPFLFLLFRRLAGKEVASWGTLFYFALPFTTLYSRVCLVDITALFFNIAGFYWAVRFWQERDTRQIFNATFFLTLSGLTKTTIWFGGTVAVSLFLFHDFVNVGRSKKLYLALLSLFVQIIMNGLWIHWANQSFATTGMPDTGWILGTLSGRLVLHNYVLLLSTFFKIVLNYWAIIPFVFGFLLWKQNRFNFLLLIVFILAPLMTFFNVSLYHDYYFLALLVPTLFLIGIGMKNIFELSLKRQYAVLSIIGLGILFSARSLPAFFNTVLTERSLERIEGEEISALTDKSDLIFSDLYSPRIGFAVESDRLFVMNPSTSLKSFPPTVYYFKKEPSLAWLSHQNPQRVSVQENYGDRYVYRTLDSGRHVFDRTRHIAVENLKSAESNFKVSDIGEVKVNPCVSPKGFLIGKIVSDPNRILEINFEKTKTKILMPVAVSINIPGKSVWGCDVRLSTRTPIDDDPGYFFVFPKDQRVILNK